MKIDTYSDKTTPKPNKSLNPLLLQQSLLLYVIHSLLHRNLEFSSRKNTWMLREYCTFLFEFPSKPGKSWDYDYETMTPNHLEAWEIDHVTYSTYAPQFAPQVPRLQ